jgi:hypothetical protein
MHYFLIILLTITNSAIAAEDVELGFFDKSHQFVSKQITSVSKGFDLLFGNKQFDDAKGTTVSVEQYFTSIQDKSLIKETRVRAKWIFPNMKKKLRLVVSQSSRITEANQQNQEAELRTKATKTDDSLSAGLSYSIRNYEKFKFSLSSGVLIRDPLDLYIRSSLRYKKYLNWTNIFITQKIFLYKEDGLGSSLKIDLKNKVSENKTYIYGNFFYWYNTTDKVEYITGPTFVHEISDRRKISYNMKFLFSNKPTEQLYGHLLFVNYRQRLHNKWLYAELIPSLEFPRNNNWKRIAAITIKLQAIFGDVR